MVSTVHAVISVLMLLKLQSVTNFSDRAAGRLGRGGKYLVLPSVFNLKRLSRHTVLKIIK